MTRRRVKNVSREPIDLSGGRPLAPGEATDELVAIGPHERALQRVGALLVLEPKPRPRRRRT
jgi:hypothetical protein